MTKKKRKEEEGKTMRTPVRQDKKLERGKKGGQYFTIEKKKLERSKNTKRKYKGKKRRTQEKR